MEATWNTIYREACIASDAASIVSPLWIDAESDSESEAISESVRRYLHDRSDIAFEFCDVVNRRVATEPIEECDIPF